MPIARRLLKVVLVIIGGVVILLAGALLALQTDWGRNQVRSIAERQASSALGAQVTIARLEGSLLYGASIDRIAVTDEGREIMSAERVSARYDLMDLLRGRFALDEIVLDGPVVYADALSLLGREEPADPPPTRQPFSIARLVITNGLVIVGEQPSEVGGVEIPDVLRDVQADLSVTIGAEDLNIAVAHLSFVGEAPDVTLRELSGTVSVEDDDLRLEDVAVQLAESSMTVSGTIDNFRSFGGPDGTSADTDDVALSLLWIAIPEAAAQQGATPRINLRVERARLSLEELQRLVPALERVAMPEDLVVDRLDASGPLDNLTLDFQFRTSESRLSGEVTGNFEGSVRTARGVMTVDSLNLVELLSRPSLPTELTGEISFDVAIATDGDVPAITGEYALQIDRMALDDYAASDVRSKGRFERQTLVLEELGARVLGGRVSARGRVGMPVGNRALSYDLSGSIAGVNLSNLPDTLPVPPVEGRVTLTYSVRDRGRGPTGRIRLGDTRLAGATIGAGTTATFDMTGDEVAYTAEGTVRGLNPQALGEALDIEALREDRFAGDITAAFTAKGRGAEVDPLTLSITDSRVLGGTVPELTATITRSLDRVGVVAAGRFENLQTHLAAENAPEGNVSGSVDVNATIEQLNDTFHWLGAGADLTLALNGTVEGVEIERLALAASARDQVVQLHEFAAEGPAVTVSASGTIALDGATNTQATYQVVVPQLGAFADLLGRTVAGDVRAQGEVSGTGPLRVLGTVAGTSLDYAGMEATTLNVDHDVSVLPADLAAARVEALVDATFVRVAGRTLTSVAVDADYSERELVFDAEIHEADRTIQSMGRLVLLPEGQEVHLTSFRFEAPGSRWEMPASAPARIDYGPERIVVEGLRLETADGQAIVAEGVLGRTTNEGPLNVSIAGLALQDLDALLFGGRGVAGRLNLDAELTGPLDAIGAVATLSIDEGGVGRYKFERLESTIEATEAEIGFTARLQQNPEASLSAEGTVPRALLGDDAPEGIEMNVAVTSSPLGLGFIGGFTHAVQNVQGTLQADVRVTGTPRAPRFDGQVVVSDGAFEVEDLGTLYTGLDTVITFEPETLVISEFNLLDENDQPMRVAGRLPYSGGGLGEVTIQIETDNFEVIDNQMGDVQVSTALSVTGTLVEPRLEGTVRVTDATLRVDQIMDLRSESYYRAEPLAGDPGNEALVGSTEVPAGLLADTPVALGLVLEMPAVVLAGRDLQGPGSTPVGLGNVNITVSGDLDLDKPLDGPLIITGDVTTVRGTYEFQGRRFDILRDGQVRFPGLVEMDPLIDIRAQRTISGVQTEIGISGTLQQPELTLSSQPPLDEADILSLIIFNQPANQLGTAEQVSLGQRAAALASGFVASHLAESIGGALELDILEIDTGTSTGSSAGVTIGEQIGERLFLRVRQGFGSAGATQLMLEYEFTDWLRLQSTVSDDRGGSESLFQRSERSGVNWIFLFSY